MDINCAFFKSTLMAISLTVAAFSQPLPADWSCYLPENSPIDIEAQVFSGRPNPVFTIADTATLHAIYSRLYFYYDSAVALGGATSCPSQLGYQGLVIEPGCYPSFSLCNGKVVISRSLYDSRLFTLLDPQSELERMVIHAVMREQVGMPDTNGAVYLSDIVPDSLTLPVRKFGIITWEILSDSTQFDFSLLDTPFHSMMSAGPGYVFPDVKLRWLQFSSVSPALYSIQAPYSSTQPMTVDWRDPINDIANPVSANVLDSLREDFLQWVDTLDTTCLILSICGDSNNGVFVRTSERGLAYVKPIGNYIGGIDRVYFFFAYASDGMFDTSFSTAISSAPNINRSFPGLSVGHFVLYDLKGRIVRDAISVNKRMTGTISHRTLILDNRSGMRILVPVAK